MRCLKCCAVVSGILLVLGTTSAFAQTTQPASKAVQEALKYSPPEAMALIHVDTKVFCPIAKDILQVFLTTMKEDRADGTLPPSTEKPVTKVEQCLDLIQANFDAVELYAYPQGVVLVVAYRSADSSEEVIPKLLESCQSILFSAVAQDGLQPESLPAPPPPENGRYTIPGFPIAAISGKEASDLPDDVVLFGLAPVLTPEFIASLGKTPPAKLVSLLEKIDTAKPLWGAVAMPETASPDAPAGIYGWLDPAGTGEMNVTFSFAPEGADNASSIKDMLVKFDLTDSLTATAEGTDVTLSLVESETPFSERLHAVAAASLRRARAMAKQAVTRTRLQGLGTAVILYDQSTGHLPKNWDVLVEEGLASEKNFGSPFSKNPPPVWDAETKAIKGDVDFVLIDFSSKTMDDIQPVGEVLLAYAKPEMYKDYPYLKIPVVFMDGHVDEMDAALLEKYIAGAKAVQAGKPLPELPPIPRKNPPAEIRPARADKPEIEWHAYCLEAKKEFVVNPRKTEPLGNRGVDVSSPFIMSPFTKKQTAVIMTLCPNCEKYFVPEYMKNMLEDQKNNKTGEMVPPPMDGKLVCSHCNTDIIQWYRDHRKKRGATPQPQPRSRPAAAEDNDF